MGVRRERPPAERSHTTIRLRLPDGTVKEMPTDDVRGPLSSGPCCFCGRETGGDAIQLSARWLHDGREHTQTWEAHRACLGSRMHESVAGIGPFFGD